MNSAFTQEQARHLMRRVEGEAKAAGATLTAVASAATNAREKIRRLYQLAYQRSPDEDELTLAETFVQRPVIAAELEEMGSSGWKYGSGLFDAEMNRVREFTVMKVRKDGRLIPGNTFPDARFGHLSVTATGGHPGPGAGLASIRRWTAPALGKIKIEGALGHTSENGDGVRGRIVSSARGKLGEWTVRNSKAETAVEFDVHGGETIDFVVECVANATADGYTWAPNIAFTPDPEAIDTVARTWNAKKDFETAAKPAAPLTRWEEFAQVLLLSNELAFVD
jgi:hypothetical protein